MPSVGGLELDGFRIVRNISEGHFGSVFEAECLTSQRRVAVKRVRARPLMPGLTWDPWQRSAEREVEILSQTRHENVVALLHHVIEGSTTLMVYEYMAWDLASVLRSRSPPMAEGFSKAVLQMLLRGLSYIHHCGVMHRDIKPANLLLEGGSGIIKIADFGSSRRFRSTEPEDGAEAISLDCSSCDGQMTRDICTRWFKSPEMLFGSVDYTVTVDIWAAGCVFAEMLSSTCKAPFPGSSDLEQLCLIFQTLGTPDERDWPEIRDLPDYNKVQFVERESQAFEFESSCSFPSVELLKRMLLLNPNRRISAFEALKSECFAASPPPVDAHLLVASLDESTRCHGAGPHEACSGPLTPLAGSSTDSGRSCDFEAVPIMTTACDLWDDTALSSAGSGVEAADSRQAAKDAPFEVGYDNGRLVHGRQIHTTSCGPEGGRRRTPSPPKTGGAHRLKPGR